MKNKKKRQFVIVEKTKKGQTILCPQCGNELYGNVKNFCCPMCNEPLYAIYKFNGSKRVLNRPEQVIKGGR